MFSSQDIIQIRWWKIGILLILFLEKYWFPLFSSKEWFSKLVISTLWKTFWKFGGGGSFGLSQGDTSSIYWAFPGKPGVPPGRTSHPKNDPASCVTFNCPTGHTDRSQFCLQLPELESNPILQIKTKFLYLIQYFYKCNNYESQGKTEFLKNNDFQQRAQELPLWYFCWQMAKSSKIAKQ